MAEMNIAVRGGRACGKTALLTLLADALGDHGSLKRYHNADGIEQAMVVIDDPVELAAVASRTYQTLEDIRPKFEPQADLIDRLHIRATIRRSITTRKSVQEGQPDRISDLLDEAGTELTNARRIIGNLVKLIEEAPVFEITWNDVGYIVEARKFIGLGGTVTVSEPMKASEMNHADRT